MTRLRTYSIRGLLIAVTIAGGLCAWGTHKLRHHQERIEASAALQSDVCMGDTAELPWYVVTAYRWRGLDQPLCYGDHICVRPSAKITDEKLSQVARLQDLTRLSFYCEMNVTDDGLQQLGQLPHLRYLNFHSAKLSAEAVERLKRALPNCDVKWRPPVAETANSETETQQQ